MIYMIRMACALLFMVAPVNIPEKVESAPQVRVETARTWTSEASSDWRRVVMIAGVILAATLCVICYITGATLYSFCFFSLFAVTAFGGYYVWQVASLKSLSEEVARLREVRELFHNQSSSLFGQLDEFLEQLHLKTDAFAEHADKLGGDVQGSVETLKIESARLQLAAETVLKRFSELLQDDVLQKKQEELERLALRLGEYTGRLEAAARQLPRLEALVNAFEEKLIHLATTEGGLSESAASLASSVSELRSLLHEIK